jgi:C1A family cysteine protease
MADRAMGWLPDHPDMRDHTPESQSVPPPQGETQDVPALLDRIGAMKQAPPDALPAAVDLRADFPPIEDQGSLGSCTANAAAGVMEYFERAAFGNHLDASRLFIYKATRNLMRSQGDSGAFLRTTMQAMVTFGVPPESYLPYQVETFDEEPSAFCYAFASNYKAIQYYRLDPHGTSVDDLLVRIKTNLHAKLPSMFGFTVFSSYRQADRTGEIPFPTAHDSRVGGHAIVACGYDDTKQIVHAGHGADPTVGAFLIRNSWGTGWGDGGYGWLPYEYVRRSLAIDWWSLIKSTWIDTGAFGG